MSYWEEADATAWAIEYELAQRGYQTNLYEHADTGDTPHVYAVLDDLQVQVDVAYGRPSGMIYTVRWESATSEGAFTKHIKKGGPKTDAKKIVDLIEKAR